MRWIVLLAVCACAEDRSLPGSTATGTVHPAGIDDVASENFHGKEVARRGYDLHVCAKCHGDDFDGGKAGVSCNGCHDGGPAACNTCHAATPATGNHTIHREAKLACTECHRVPDRWDAEGHIGSVDVTFGTLASLNTSPTFTNGECAVYCHGATRPRWSATPVKACDRCHGAPPASHAQSQCASCHPASAPHVDGVVQVGAACDSCHGRNDDAAPPRDLAGNEFTTALGVGAHQAHLRSSLGAQIPCAACHAVPATVGAVGHIDSPLPAEVDASLGWNRATGTCASAWCHGPATPTWTTTGGAYCGSCHGVPPSTASHTPNMPVTSCATCHPGGAMHIDGVLDVL